MSEAWHIDAAQIVASPRFAAGLAALAARTGLGEDELRRRAIACLHELRTGHTPWIHRLNIWAGRKLCHRGYEAIDYDATQVERVRALLGSQSTVVLSSHKSYLDGGALNVGFNDHGLPPLTGIAGINMAFWPLGPAWRRANGVFIRRSGGDPVYSFALRQLLGCLLERRRPLQWFIEGTRSRTGKLGPPRLGLLVYAVDAWRESRCEDLLLLPVAVAYDQLRESQEYAAQARGATKAPETLGGLLRFVRGQRGRCGRIYVRFGEPVSLRAALGSPALLPPADSPQMNRVLRGLAFEVSRRINRAIPITGAALLTLALLAARGRALSPGQLRIAVRGYLEHARYHGHTLAPSAQALDGDAGVAAVLEGLRPDGLVEAIGGGTTDVYRIGAGRELQAAYYRNTIVHFYLEGAIAELALLQAARVSRQGRAAAFAAEVLALRDLLEHEFFFPDAPQWQRDVERELGRLAPDWHERLDEGEAGARAVLGRMATLSSDMMLRPFIEGFTIVADVLVASGAGAALPEPQWKAGALALGAQYLAQRRLQHADAVSGHLLGSAERLVRRRSLCDPGEDVLARRQAFVAQLQSILARMDVVRGIAVRRVAQDPATGG